MKASPSPCVQGRSMGIECHKATRTQSFLQPFFPAVQGLAFLEAMFYVRMPFLMPTLVASYDTQGYGTPNFMLLGSII